MTKRLFGILTLVAVFAALLVWLDRSRTKPPPQATRSSGEAPPTAPIEQPAAPTPAPDIPVVPPAKETPSRKPDLPIPARERPRPSQAPPDVAPRAVAEPAPAPAAPVAPPPAPAPPVAPPPAPSPRAEKPAPPVPLPDAPLVPLPEVAAPAPPAIAAGTAATSHPEFAAVQRVVGRYEQSYRQLDVNAVAAIWPSVNARELSRIFARVLRQELQFDSCVIAVAESRATATCSGSLTYVPRVGSNVARTERHSWSIELQRAGEGWQIAEVKAR
jgi:hypothetical protein